MDQRMIAIDEIAESKSNPRGKMLAGSIADLIESVKAHGILQPLLVRPTETGSYGLELVCGHRRLAAARAAGMDVVPCVVRPMTAEAALELQLVENLQRADMHPFEEARGYAELLRRNYTNAQIGDRIGRSVAYVYDRLRLLGLTKDAQNLFREDRFTTAHAVLLARLSPADQTRVIEAQGHDSLFEGEHTLFDPGADDEDAVERRNPYDGKKPKSVRELQAWVDEHVRFNPEAKDVPQLFPETAVALEGAGKVVAVTYSNYIPESARDGVTIGPRSWRRADGKAGSKPCASSVTGYVAVGPGRGSAFAVCVAKDTCTVHWKERIAERAKAAKLKAAAPAKAAGAKVAAKSAPEPERVDQKLLNAIHEAIGKARELAAEKLRTLACEATPETFLRAFVRSLDTFHVANHGKAFGDKAAAAVNTDAKLAKWAAEAPLAGLQGACFENVLEYGDQVQFALALGVDLTNLERDVEKDVRAEWAAKAKAEKSAAAKSTPAKPSAKKGGRK